MDNPEIPELLTSFSMLNMVVLLLRMLRLVVEEPDDTNQLAAIRRRRQRLFNLHMMRLLRRREIFRSCGSVPQILLPAAGNFWDNAVPLLTADEFQKKFRLSRETFDILVTALSHMLRKNDTVMKRAIPVPKRIAICLYVLISNACSDVIADLFGVGRSTISYLLMEFCDAVNDPLYDRYIQFPKTHAEKQAVVQGFMDRWQFPGCFGSLDGTHIPILAPIENPEEYYNYKSFHSIVLLGLVDFNYKFLYTNIGRPGRVNDATIYRDSGLFKELQRNKPNLQHHIIGDGAFPLSNFLMKPYSIYFNMPAQKEYFNRRISRARVTVEDAFGRLKGRWRIIMKRSDFSLENMKKIVQSCVVLHNICEEHREQFHANWQERVQEFDRLYPQPQQGIRNQRAPPLAKQKRDRLAARLLNDGIQFINP